jgi:hypothetical protein
MHVTSWFHRFRTVLATRGRHQRPRSDHALAHDTELSLGALALVAGGAVVAMNVPQDHVPIDVGSFSSGEGF